MRLRSKFLSLIFAMFVVIGWVIALAVNQVILMVVAMVIIAGLTGVVTVRLAEPQFEGQTKEVLGTNAVRGIVSRVVERELTLTFEELLAYSERHLLPANPLLAQGYPSIGCAPCTRANGRAMTGPRSS